MPTWCEKKDSGKDHTCIKQMSSMVLKECSSGLLTVLEILMKFGKMMLFHCKEIYFVFGTIIGFTTNDITRFKHILVFWKIKLVTYLCK